MQWYSVALPRILAGRMPLHLNVGETAECLYQGGRRGNIFLWGNTTIIMIIILTMKLMMTTLGKH